MKIKVVFYSTYGHMYQMAEAAAEGAREVAGAEVTHGDLIEADGLIFGIPTRFGNMCGQARSFFDSTGPLWANGSLIGKVGSVMTSSAAQHGGQETTITSTHTTLLHHGLVIVGLSCSFQGQMRIDEISGASPYGASTITGGGAAARGVRLLGDGWNEPARSADLASCSTRVQPTVYNGIPKK